MDSSPGSKARVGNTASEQLLQRIQELERRLASAEEISKALVNSATASTIGESVTSNTGNDQQVTTSPQAEIDQEIGKLQRNDPDLQPIITLLECGELPPNEKVAKKLALEQDQYDIIDGILHHENPANQGYWRIVVPKTLQQEVLEEAHLGRFASHFAERRVYNTLRKSYWWKGMRAAVRTHCRSCLTCATRKGTGRASRPPLQPIVVGGPFHRMGVHVLQLPLSLVTSMP